VVLPPQTATSLTRTVLKAVAALALATALLIAAVAVRISFLVPALFKLNRQCQEEGYYMAEFEFKMLGFAYLLDKGRYWDAVSGLQRLHGKLKSRDQLVKVPRFRDKEEELDFYLSLQNPRTGAFMDDSFPYCTYAAPTQTCCSTSTPSPRRRGGPCA
jgi:hypothetical protein